MSDFCFTCASGADILTRPFFQESVYMIYVTTVAFVLAIVCPLPAIIFIRRFRVRSRHHLHFRSCENFSVACFPFDYYSNMDWAISGVLVAPVEHDCQFRLIMLGV